MRGILEPEHLLIILAVVVFMFGGKKIPELAGSLGKGVTEFKRGLHGGHHQPDARTAPAVAPTLAAQPATETAPTVVEREPKRLL